MQPSEKVIKNIYTIDTNTNQGDCYTFPEEATPFIKMRATQIHEKRRQSVRRHSGMPRPSSILSNCFSTFLLHNKSQC